MYNWEICFHFPLSIYELYANYFKCCMYAVCNPLSDKTGEFREHQTAPFFQQVCSIFWPPGGGKVQDKRALLYIVTVTVLYSNW